MIYIPSCEIPQATITEKLATAALKNKSVQNAVKKSLFESVVGKNQSEAEEEQRVHDASVIQGKIAPRKMKYFPSANLHLPRPEPICVN